MIRLDEYQESSLSDNPREDEARALLVDVVHVFGLLVDRCSPAARNYLRPAIDAAEILTDIALTHPTGLARLRVAKSRWTVLDAFFAVVVAPDSPADPSFVREARSAARDAGIGSACAAIRERVARLSPPALPHLPDETTNPARRIQGCYK